MKILDRYLLVEIAKVFIAIISILIIIIFSTTFIKLLQLVSEGSLGNEVVWRLAGLEILRVSGKLIPPAFFLAILFTLGRMYRDSEVTAMFASGISVGHLFRAVFISAIPVTALVGWLTLSVLPASALMIETIKNSQKDVAALVGLGSGRFHEFQDGQLVVFLGELNRDDNSIKDVFIRQHNGNNVSLVTASSGIHFEDVETGDRIIELREGNRYEGIPGKTEFSVGKFDTYSLRIASELQKDSFIEIRARATGDLIGDDSPRARSELQYRLAAPVSVLVFTLVSIPFSRSSPRQSVFGRLAAGVASYFIYLNLQRAAENWMSTGITPLWIGLWWVLFVVTVAAIIVILHDNGTFRRWFAAPKGAKQ